MLRALGLASFCLATAVAQSNFPAPPSPTSNPQTPHKELLGMALFFEEQLSSTGTTACATCHDFAHGGGDPRTADSVNPPMAKIPLANPPRAMPPIALGPIAIQPRAVCLRPWRWAWLTM